MNIGGAKGTTSVRINAEILEQIRRDARAENRSLSNYLEVLLYRFGYRPYNEETLNAIQEVKQGLYGGEVDTTSRESIDRSLFED